MPLGAGDSIVGVTVYDRPVLPGRTVVGDFVNPSIEKIVSLKPDLVLAGAWENSRVVPELKRLGMTVVEVRNPTSLTELYATIKQVAEAVGKKDKACVVISDMRIHLETLHARAPQPPLSLYIEIDAPLWTLAGHDFLSEALCGIGLCSMLSNSTHAASQVSAETIIERNPDVIISLDATKAEIEHRPGWDRIRAVERGWIIDRNDVNPDRLSRPSPRLVEGLTQVAAQLDHFRSAR